MPGAVRIIGAANVLNEWQEILDEGWTTSPRRKVPANAGRQARGGSRSSFRDGSASSQSFKQSSR